jgi:hypothetical protein
MFWLCPEHSNSLSHKYTVLPENNNVHSRLNVQLELARVRRGLRRMVVTSSRSSRGSGCRCRAFSSLTSSSIANVCQSWRSLSGLSGSADIPIPMIVDHCCFWLDRIPIHKEAVNIFDSRKDVNHILWLC